MSWSQTFNIVPFKQPAQKSNICRFDSNCENWSCTLLHPSKNPSNVDVNMNKNTSKQNNKSKSKPKKKVKNRSLSTSKSSNNNDINMDHIEVIRQQQQNYYNDNKSEKEQVTKVIHLHDNSSQYNYDHVETQNNIHNYPTKISLEAVREFDDKQFSRYERLFKYQNQQHPKKNNQ